MGLSPLERGGRRARDRRGLLRKGQQCRRRLRDGPAPRPPRPCGPRTGLGRAGRADRRRRGEFRDHPPRGPGGRDFRQSARRGGPGAAFDRRGLDRGRPAGHGRPRRDPTAARRRDRPDQRGRRPQAGRGPAQRTGLRHGPAGPAHDSGRRDLYVRGRKARFWPPGPTATPERSTCWISAFPADSSKRYWGRKGIRSASSAGLPTPPRRGPKGLQGSGDLRSAAWLGRRPATTRNP